MSIDIVPVKAGQVVVCWTCTFNKLTEQKVRQGKANEAITTLTEDAQVIDHWEEHPDHMTVIVTQVHNMLEMKKHALDGGP